MSRQHFQVMPGFLSGWDAVASTAFAMIDEAPPANPWSAVAAPTMLDSVHWFRDASQPRAIYGEAAYSVCAFATGLPPGSWDAILEIDETILDKSDYQERQAFSGHGFTGDLWSGTRDFTSLNPMYRSLDPNAIDRKGSSRNGDHATQALTGD